MNYFDIAILLLVLIGSAIGFAKGFFKTLSSLFSWVVSVIVSALLAKVVANMLVDIPFVSNLFLHNPDGFSFAGWIYELLPENLQIDMNIVRGWIIEDGQIVEGASGILIEHIKNENAFLGIIMEIFETSYMEMLISTEVLSYDFANLSQVIALLLAHSLLIFFTGLFLLLVFKIIINIVIKLLEKKYKVKEEGLTVFNRFLGMLLGSIQGFLTCAAILASISFMLTFPIFEGPRKTLLEDESLIAGKFAKLVFGNVDRLLIDNDISKTLSYSGFEATVDLNGDFPKDEDIDDESETAEIDNDIQVESFDGMLKRLAA